MKSSAYKSVPIKSSEITSETDYLNRRQFLKTFGIASASALILAACGGNPEVLDPSSSGTNQNGTPPVNPADFPGEANTFEEITNYNNYYEFSLNKESVARLAEDFQTSPWNVEVYGLVDKPKTFGIEDLMKIDQEERIYRMRCVEGWSMVIPWLGFPLSKMLAEVSPLSTATHVRFETLADPNQMPGLANKSFPWPYQEGLRMDEAMNDLTILSTGLYGKSLLPQNGAPIRLVVPWKYGFKSVKSIVKIELVDYQPSTLWSTVAPNEYGFFANVNPEVDHPRWSQATERQIGESGRKRTLMFNGYAEQVADMYAGMDLSKYY